MWWVHFQIALTSKHVAGVVEFRSVSSEGSKNNIKIINYQKQQTIIKGNITPHHADI